MFSGNCNLHRAPEHCTECAIGKGAGYYANIGAHTQLHFAAELRTRGIRRDTQKGHDRKYPRD
jgi:hypothetical protein